jgi:ubiquinone/menaquinone biosynthesis C-methylase UbiE
MPDLSSSDDLFSEFRSNRAPRGILGFLIRAGASVLYVFLRFAFHLLYYPLAFTYDAVAWIVSGGEWAEWRRCVFPYLLPGPVLEMAHGTGTLALELAAMDLSVAAVDLSPAMGKIARRKKRKWMAERSRPDGLPTALGPDRSASPIFVRADVRQLPFPDEFFSSAVATFPADFIFQRRTVGEVHRTLRPGGRWIILPTAYPEWLAKHLLPGSGNPSPYNFSSIFTRLLESTGFAVRTEILRRSRSRVMILLAEKTKRP